MVIEVKSNASKNSAGGSKLQTIGQSGLLEAIGKGLKQTYEIDRPTSPWVTRDRSPSQMSAQNIQKQSGPRLTLAVGEQKPLYSTAVQFNKNEDKVIDDKIEQLDRLVELS